MKTLSFIVAVLLAVTQLSHAQQPTKIVIRFVNGRDGKSIKDKKVNIWLGDQKLFWLDTDSKGQITLDVSSTQPRELAVMPNFLFDCRAERDSIIGKSVKYPLDEILSKGIVGNNLCGTISMSPTPGVLVLFARPRTTKEKREL